MSLVFIVFLLTNVFGQQHNLINYRSDNLKKIDLPIIDNSTVLLTNSHYKLSNPALVEFDSKCQIENINPTRFDQSFNIEQKVEVCEALQNILVQLNQNWSPQLQDEINQMWQVFISQNIKIRPMKSGVSSSIVAAAEAFTEKNVVFNASIYLRPEKFKQKSFFLVFIHELRHIYDFYQLWQNRGSISEAEFEKRGFRVMSKVYQETPKKEHFFRLQTFWEDNWKNLSTDKIESRREDKIESWMKKNSFYKNLLKNPEKNQVSFSTGISTEKANFDQMEDNDPTSGKGEMVPAKSLAPEITKVVPQNVQELSFETEKSKSSDNPAELLAAAILNEKKLYQKMDNFVYDQDFQLLCWEKQRISEKFEFSNFIARTNQGESLTREVSFTKTSAKQIKLPKCIRNIDSVKIDSNETFWSAPYLDEMPVKFDKYTEVDGVQVAQYQVGYPTQTQYNQIAAKYPHIKLFKTFVGTIYISVKDAQIIKFWGTSFPEVTKNSDTSNVVGSYGATAVRQKLSSGIWVTTFLNIVAATLEKEKIKPFSIMVQYKNYRQADSTVKILDDDSSVITE